MNASKERVMHYHADANPIGGLLSHPFERVVPSHASVSLSKAGGHAAARIDDFHLDDLIHTGAAHARVVGSVEKRNGNWTTLVTSVVERLNVLQIVTADRLVAQIAVEHPRDGYYPKVSFAGSQFDNLRINGRLVEISFDHHFVTAPETSSTPQGGAEGSMLHPEEAVHGTLLEFPGKPWTEVESFARRAADQKRKLAGAHGAPEWIKQRYKATDGGAERSHRNQISCSLVQKISGAGPCPSYGHIIHVNGLGNLFLGELDVTHHGFDVTMLRIEMGCAAGGVVAFAGGTANGHTFP